MAVQGGMVQVGELHGVAKFVWWPSQLWWWPRVVALCRVVAGSGPRRLALLGNRQCGVG
jgi:hypothetical protein